MIDRASWAAAWQRLGARTPSEDIHRRLVECWSQKHRHYHTLQHLRECFEHLEAARAEARHAEEIAVALWFHDAFYEPERDDNELRSADWAQETAIEAGVPLEVAHRLHDMVMATCDHMPHADPDTQLLVDIDLSIFGADDARFDESNGQIRREFAHVKEEDWGPGRRRMLRTFLDRPRLFGTQRFHDLLEARARRNITRALEQLGN